MDIKGIAINVKASVKETIMEIWKAKSVNLALAIAWTIASIIINDMGMRIACTVNIFLNLFLSVHLGFLSGRNDGQKEMVEMTDKLVKKLNERTIAAEKLHKSFMVIGEDNGKRIST